MLVSGWLRVVSFGLLWSFCVLFVQWSKSSALKRAEQGGMLRSQKRCFLTKRCLFCFLTLLLVKTLVFWSIFGQKTSFFMRVNFLRKKIKKYFFPSFCHLNIAPRCVKIAQNNYDIYYWRFSRNTLQCTDKNRIMHQNAQWRLLM